MTGDWLDRAAIAAGEPLTRGRLLKAAGTSALVLGPLRVFFGSDVSYGAAVDRNDDCHDCVAASAADLAAERRKCVTILSTGLGLFFGIGCLAGTLTPPAYLECRQKCKAPPPTAPWTSPATPWAPPPTKTLTTPTKPGYEQCALTTQACSSPAPGSPLVCCYETDACCTCAGGNTICCYSQSECAACCGDG